MSRTDAGKGCEKANRCLLRQNSRHGESHTRPKHGQGAHGYGVLSAGLTQPSNTHCICHQDEVTAALWIYFEKHRVNPGKHKPYHDNSSDNAANKSTGFRIGIFRFLRVAVGGRVGLAMLMFASWTAITTITYVLITTPSAYCHRGGLRL